MKNRVERRYRVALILVLTFVTSAFADSHDGVGPLKDLHKKVEHLLEESTPEHPFYLHAEARKHIEMGDAAFYMPTPFDELSVALTEVANWCEILPLHLNVKGCVFDDAADDAELTLFLGHKNYQSTEDAHRIDYEFSSEVADDYFEARFYADKGPLGTSDYRIEFEAMPAGDSTFARLRTSEHQSWISSKAMNVYLSTKGADKRGISVVGHDDSGRPLYSAGEQGAIERNVLRYYFAVIAFFETMEQPDHSRFESALQEWFAATERYPQLYEMDQDEYLSAKSKERANQLELQR
jgi:hypothetical protein